MEIISLLVTFVSVIHAQDPASSWLAYTKAPGGGLITYVDATWKVPADPKSSGSEPAFWFGIEPDPALNLIQPILKWLGNGWYIFNEYYEWDTGHDYQSPRGRVKAGQTIFASIQYQSRNNSYLMFITCNETGWKRWDSIKVERSSITYCDVYAVVEHQPNRCSQYPADGKIIFTDFHITVSDKAITPKWSAHQYKPKCDCKAEVLSSSSVEFTWNPEYNISETNSSETKT